MSASARLRSLGLSSMALRRVAVVLQAFPRKSSNRPKWNVDSNKCLPQTRRLTDVPKWGRMVNEMVVRRGRMVLFETSGRIGACHKPDA